MDGNGWCTVQWDCAKTFHNVLLSVNVVFSKTFTKFEQVANEVKSIIRNKMNERLQQLKELEISAPLLNGRMINRSQSLDSESSFNESL